MKKRLIPIIVISCILFSCNNANDSKDTVSIASSDSSSGTGTQQVQSSMQVESTANSGTFIAPDLSPSVSSSSATTASGMNPPHGEPGHRCDIAVGAPLNSPAPKMPGSNNDIQASTQSNPQAPLTASEVKTATAPGMNPPHGEPGHDCAIPVGAPLKK